MKSRCEIIIILSDIFAFFVASSKTYQCWGSDVSNGWIVASFAIFAILIKDMKSIFVK